VNKSLWGIALATTVFAGAMIVRAEDTPTTEPSKHAGIRIIKPYSEIPDLTDEEKVKISSIHKKVLEETKALDLKEDDDIRAVLTDDQKAELDKIIADKKEKTAEKSKEKKEAAATEPAAG
jgi:hypothetical protein